MMLVKKVIAPTKVVKSKAAIGTPRLLVFWKMRGAKPELPIAHSIRVDAYIPELAEDSTEVRITAFIRLAAPAMPMRLKTNVNGEIATLLTEAPSKLGLVYGIIAAMIAIDKM